MHALHVVAQEVSDQYDVSATVLATLHRLAATTVAVLTHVYRRQRCQLPHQSSL